MRDDDADGRSAPATPAPTPRADDEADTAPTQGHTDPDRALRDPDAKRNQRSAVDRLAIADADPDLHTDSDVRSHARAHPSTDRRTDGDAGTHGACDQVRSGDVHPGSADDPG